MTVTTRARRERGVRRAVVWPAGDAHTGHAPDARGHERSGLRAFLASVPSSGEESLVQLRLRDRDGRRTDRRAREPAGRRGCVPFVLTAIGLAIVIVGVYVVSNVWKEPLYDVMLAWDPEAMPTEWRAGRRRYFAINWIQAAATWTVFALFLAALIAAYGVSMTQARGPMSAGRDAAPRRAYVNLSGRGGHGPAASRNPWSTRWKIP